MKQTQKITVVIPVFNEELYIESCLEALLEQPNIAEIIVVDNNSQDTTLSIVSSYESVRIIHEPRQGQVFARKTGFDAVRTDILATVDADTIVRSNWSEVILSAFKKPDIAAVSAFVGAHDEKSNRLDAIGRALFNWYEFSLSHFIAGHGFLYGSNMALRRSVWKLISKDLRLTQSIWEDLQIAILINDRGLKIATAPTICADISVRRFRDHTFKHVAWYLSGYMRTFRDYHKTGALVRATIAYIIQLPSVAVFRLFLIFRSWSRKRAAILSKRLEQQFIRLR